MTIYDFVGRPVDWVGNRRQGAWQLMTVDGDNSHVRRLHDGAWAKIESQKIRVPVYVRKDDIVPTRLPVDALSSVGNYSSSARGYCGCTLAPRVLS